MDALARRIDADPRYALRGAARARLLRETGESANSLYFIVIGLAVLAGIGAAFGATQHALRRGAIAARRDRHLCARSASRRHRNRRLVLIESARDRVSAALRWVQALRRLLRAPGLVLARRHRLAPRPSPPT